MASREVTGGTEDEIATIQGRYYNTPLYQDHGVSFEAAYCLVPIGKQPDEYDGPQRYCRNRVGKREGLKDEYHDEAYKYNCRFHMGDCNGGSMSHNLTPYTAAITHGIYTEDEHLRMDFSDAEQTLYDGIVEAWPDIYGWPAESDDPARYLILRKVATNVVRSNRAEDYLDDEGEVRIRDVYNEEGIVVEPDGHHEENPLSREYRLLIGEIMSMLKELGLTPKERAKMDKVEAETGAAEAISEIAGDALDADGEYDPTQFDNGDTDD